MNGLGWYWYTQDTWQSFALLEMLKRAGGIGLKKGVAAVLVTKKGESMSNMRFAVVESKFSREGRGDGDKGTNYYAVVQAKIAVMMRTGVDSGTLPENELRFGESKFRGGLVRKDGDYTIYVAFSGATEDEDVEIAKLGMQMMMVDSKLIQ